VDAEIDGWLRGEGLVVTSSDRAALALRSAFHRRRRAEGLTAWVAPNILDWKTLARNAWEEQRPDDRLLLNSTQEEALWADVIRDQQHLTTTLPDSVHRLAAMAMTAHELLCSYSPRHLRESARANWDRDPGTFSGWLTAFQQACTKSSLISPACLALELIPLLETGKGQRPRILAAGFDRLTPLQSQLFDKWAPWQKLTPEEPADQVLFYEASDSQTELEACAKWCSQRAHANPHSRQLVITQDISLRRGEIERAFLQFAPPASAPLFEFSLGVPLKQTALARGAHLLLRWLDGALEEAELDWLLASGLSADQDESDELQSYMRALRQRGLQRAQWSLQAFLGPAPVLPKLPVSWVQRMLIAQRILREIARSAISPLEWADKIPQLLNAMGWPGQQSRSSAEFQAQRRWQHALDTAASLGFDGRRVHWNEFLSILDRTLQQILFAPQSLDAPIQIAGPAESAGLAADDIWFLGADEESWPAVGSMHPLLPTHVQREAAMPHTTPLRDWEFSSAVTKRLVNSASLIHFSFARQKEGVETRPSRLITNIPTAPQPLAAELIPTPVKPPVSVPFTDSTRVPFRQESIQGGSSVLTSQSQCPFKAFATARLGAKDWDPAEVGLSAIQRGQILHSVLHSIWAGPPEGLRSHHDLITTADRPYLVRRHVQKILQEEIPNAIRESMPRRYLVLEEERLVHVITEWLDFEAERIPFSVAETEAKHPVSLAGVTFNLRIDRVDRLNDGSLLVIDYKTGNVSPKTWELPRPDDVQLPLYAGFGLKEKLGGFVFAKVRTGEHAFAGKVEDARATLLPQLQSSTSLVQEALTAEQLRDWKQYIEQLARDFVAGRADVDPREYPETCERCGLQAVCRIQEPENQHWLESESEAFDEEREDE